MNTCLRLAPLRFKTRRLSKSLIDCSWIIYVLSLGLFACLTMFTPSPAAAEQSEEYLLGRQDKLRLKVYEWRASRDEIFEWTALNGEFTIGASGKLALPLIGEVRAAGSTTADLANLIGVSLRSRIGLAEKPDVSIEIIQFRPFYIVGLVEKPGEYVYRPAMTVLQALSVSGGLLRSVDTGNARLEREIITAKGELELLATELSGFIARKARLEAELKRADSIEFPHALIDRQRQDPSIRQAMDQERLIFQSRKEGLETQLTALKQLKDFLAKEAVSLSGQVGTHSTQLKLLREELASVASLTEKGLATAPRRLALERNVAQLEGEGMRMDSTLLRARQEISRTEISILELDNKRVSDVTVELQQAQVNIDRLTQRMETAERLLYESEVIAPRILIDRGRSTRSRPRFTISRAMDGRVVEMPANESTHIEPADTVKVEVILGDDLGSALSTPVDGPSSLMSGPQQQRLSQDALRRSSN